MADEPITTPPADVSAAEDRIRQLSDKTKQAEEAKAASDAKASDAEKRAVFAEGFADFVSNNPAAKEFKAQIEEKYKAGVPFEDAAFAVLGKAGKLGGATPPAPPASPVGGSAGTVLPDGGKAPTDMNQAEKRDALSKVLSWS